MLNNSEFFSKAKQVEDELGCDVSAGHDYGKNVGRYYASLQIEETSKKISLAAHEELAELFDQHEIDQIMSEFGQIVLKRYSQKHSIDKSA